MTFTFSTILRVDNLTLYTKVGVYFLFMLLFVDLQLGIYWPFKFYAHVIFIVDKAMYHGCHHNSAAEQDVI